MNAETLTPIVIALIAAIPPSVIGYAALRKATQASESIATVHFQINSRMDQLLASTATASRAEGIEAERNRPTDMIVIKDEGKDHTVERVDVERRRQTKPGDDDPTT